MNARIGLAVATVIGCLFQGAALGGDNGILRARVEQQFRAMSESAHDAFDGLLFYPKDIRDACLELSQYPALVVRLNMAREFGGLAAEKALQGYPPSARAAARVLSSSPRIMGILEDDLVTTGLVGRVYADDPFTVSRIIDGMARDAQTGVNQSVDAWVTILSDDAVALGELRRASADFAVEVRNGSLASLSINVGYNFGFGFEVSPADEVAIYYTPSYYQTEYVLRYADRYPNLVNSIIFHHGRNRSHSMSDYRRAVDRWYDTRMRYYDDDFFLAAGRTKRLADAARFERRFRQTLKGRSASLAEREAYLRRYSSDYATLRGFSSRPRSVADRLRSGVGKDRVHGRLDVRGSQGRGHDGGPRRTPSGLKRPSSRTRSPGKSAVRRPTQDKGKDRIGTRNPTRSRPAGVSRVKRQAPSRDSQLNRGRRVHRSVWDRGGSRKATQSGSTKKKKRSPR